MAKTELKKGKSQAFVTGKVVITDTTFAEGVKKSEKGYVYTRLNFGIQVAEGQTIFVEMMGGYSPTNPILYSMTKDNERTTVSWTDRKNDAILDTLADYSLLKVGLERKEDGKLDIKRFLSQIDVYEYLKATLVNGMEVTVRGNLAYSEYNDNTQRKLELQSIFLPYQKKDEEGNLSPIVYGATFRQTILLDEDSFKKISKEEKEEGEVLVKAQVVDYVSKRDGQEIKKNLPFDQPIFVPINKEKPEVTDKILNAFFKVPKGKIRELTIEGKIFEGYEQSEISDKDIEMSPEVKQLIELGLLSAEDVKETLTVRGSKVSKLVFTKPFIKRDKDNGSKAVMEMDDTKYTPDDLIFALEEEEIESEVLEDLEDLGSSEESEADWMQSLGL